MKPIFIRTAIASALMLGAQGAGAAQPADDYVSGQSYAGGSQVCYEGDLYKTQWWATAAQTPADALTAENRWDSPWILETSGACESSGGTDEDSGNNNSDSDSDSGGNTDSGNSGGADSDSGDSGNSGGDSGSSGDSDTYISGQNYRKGEEVCYDGDLFVAQWWVNGDDHPTDALTAENTWGSPWLLKDADACASDGTSDNDSGGGDSDSDNDDSDNSGSDNSDNDNSDNSGDNSDSTPITVSVSASQAQISGGGSVTLNASASGGDGNLSYSWAQLSPASPEADIASATSASTRVTLPSSSEDVSYVFSLIVSDGETSGEAQVTVQNLAVEDSDEDDSDNSEGSASSVTANISTSSIDVGCSGTITLDGSGSSGGSDISYIWSQTSGPVVKMSSYTDSATSVTLSETYSDVTYTFQLTASDSTQASDVDEVSISQEGCAAADGYVMGISELEATEESITSSDALLQEVKDTVETRDNAVVEAVQPGRSANPENVLRVESILSEEDWDYLFALRADEYTYTNFLRAVAKFPAFCGDYTDGRDAEAICRKSLAVMFAHYAQETGAHATGWEVPEWRQGLYWLREIGWTEDTSGGYGACDASSSWAAEAWPCAINADGGYKSYFGRGAKQLSWNYNYGPFSQAMYSDIYTLLEAPELVADTWLNLASSIFFFVYPQPPKPSILHVIDGTWEPNSVDLANNLTAGFGVTTNIINGAIECSSGSEDYRSQYRIGYYENTAAYFGVEIPADEELGCANMGQFQTGGAASLDIYWDKDWGWSADTPDNESYACQLVNYQTAYSALNEGDYAKCVEGNFDMTIDYQD
ncbi:glycoside hydrolase family 19 protein [Microbulbifer sp. ZKSA006]|uniref:glycoside hydrolase family 19 protein n=1 Tax=Microbulbifer sp. ZKSA006 TaxID=3243390 RepID=UPI0040399A85